MNNVQHHPLLPLSHLPAKQCLFSIFFFQQRYNQCRKIRITCPHCVNRFYKIDFSFYKFASIVKNLSAATHSRNYIFAPMCINFFLIVPVFLVLPYGHRKIVPIPSMDMSYSKTLLYDIYLLPKNQRSPFLLNLFNLYTSSCNLALQLVWITSKVFRYSTSSVRIVVVCAHFVPKSHPI